MEPLPPPTATQKRIAVVAHDHKKQDLLDWACFNRDSLADHHLIVTGTTGRLLEDQPGVPDLTAYRERVLASSKRASLKRA
jgi:methylglyoxal synthase